MSEFKQSGYKVTELTVAWSTNGFDALLDNEWTDASDAIDNSSTLYLMADFEIVLGSATFVGFDSLIELYIIPSVDGTNYADWTGGAAVVADQQENNALRVGDVTTSGAVGAQRLVLRGVEMPPGKFKVGIRNRGGVTLNATNTCKWRPWQYSSV